MENAEPELEATIVGKAAPGGTDTDDTRESRPEIKASVSVPKLRKVKVKKQASTLAAAVKEQSTGAASALQGGAKDGAATLKAEAANLHSETTSLLRNGEFMADGKAMAKKGVGGVNAGIDTAQREVSKGTKNAMDVMEREASKGTKGALAAMDSAQKEAASQARGATAVIGNVRKDVQSQAKGTIAAIDSVQREAVGQARGAVASLDDVHKDAAKTVKGALATVREVPVGDLQREAEKAAKSGMSFVSKEGANFAKTGASGVREGMSTAQAEAANLAKLGASGFKGAASTLQSGASDLVSDISDFGDQLNPGNLSKMAGQLDPSSLAKMAGKVDPKDIASMLGDKFDPSDITSSLSKLGGKLDLDPSDLQNLAKANAAGLAAAKAFGAPTMTAESLGSRPWAKGSSSAFDIGSFDRDRLDYDEDVEILKARVVYRMVEDVSCQDGSKKKVLFLSNNQARMMSQTEESIMRMFDAFDIKEPDLIINLADSRLPLASCEKLQESGEASQYQISLPRLTEAECMHDEERVCNFFQEVVIPLACQTNAIILCQSMADMCLLSQQFGRAVSLERGRWKSQPPPFTVIGLCPWMQCLYANEEPHCFWVELRSLSREWKRRDQDLRAVCQANPLTPADLDFNIDNHILVDSYNPKRGVIGEMEPYEQLVGAIDAYLMKRYPCVTFKGASMLPKEFSPGVRLPSAPSGLLQKLHGDCPLILIDSRKRGVKMQTGTSLTQKERAFQEARDGMEQEDEDLMKLQRRDIHDVATLSYLHQLLCTDSTKSKQSQRYDIGAPLWQVLASQHAGQDSKESLAVPKCVDLVREACVWQADRFYRRRWQLRLDRAQREKRNETHATFYKKEIHDYANLCSKILLHPRCFSVVADDSNQGRLLMKQVVKLDRVPLAESREGLNLLRDIWNEHDVAVYMSVTYKRRSDFSTLLLLFLSIVTVVTTQTQQILSEDGAEGEWRTRLKFAMIGIEVCKGFIFFYMDYVRPTERWRHLRGMAMELESVVWQYRCRVGQFAESSGRPEAARQTLQSVFEEWRDELFSVGDFQYTQLDAHWHTSVYKHGQKQGAKVSELDDHYSPVTPEIYFERRVRPKLAKYQSGLPGLTRWRFFLQVVIYLITASSTLLATRGELVAVTILSAVMSSVTTWGEFSDLSRRLVARTAAIRQLKELSSWWERLTDVERASPIITHCLVSRGEAGIGVEASAWSTGEVGQKWSSPSAQEGESGEGLRQSADVAKTKSVSTKGGAPKPAGT